MQMPGFFENGNTFTFWKGRVGLYAILHAMGVGPGDEVILPGFTCVVVPNAVLYRGATPIYADIDPDTYNITAETVAPLITPRTRVILVQNTFGLSPDLDPIMKLAEDNGILVVEDCAHGLGASYKDRPAGTNSHAAFFSTQWSKPVSTGLGGIMLVRDHELARKLAAAVQNYPLPSLSAQGLLAAQLLVRPLADLPVLHYALVNLYRFITQKARVPVGSSLGTELESTVMPEGYLKRMSPVQARGLQKGLKTLDQKMALRRNSAAFYDDYLTRHGLTPPVRPEYADHGMLRYAIRVPDKPALLARAHEYHIPVGDWFVSPLHPVEQDLERWGYRTGQCRNAEKACAELINLFTDRPLSAKQLSLLFSAH